MTNDFGAASFDGDAGTLTADVLGPPVPQAVANAVTHSSIEAVTRGPRERPRSMPNIVSLSSGARGRARAVELCDRLIHGHYTGENRKHVFHEEVDHACLARYTDI